MRRIVLSVLGIVGFCGSLRADLLYANALPNTFLNQAAGNLRSNIAFTESDPLNEFDGTSVNFSTTAVGANGLTINSITTWSVASIIGDPLGLEFNAVDLYYRPEGGTWQILETGAPDTFFDSKNSKLVRYNNPDITSTEVGYNLKNPNYQSLDTPAVSYPLWKNTFTGLDLTLSTATNYEFAVWGTNPNADPTTLYGYWFDEYSNAFLSGAREDNKSGSYLRCSADNLSAPCFTENPRLDQTWNKGANLDILIYGTPTEIPEPGSLFLSSIVLFFFVSRLRKSTKAA